MEWHYYGDCNLLEPYVLVAINFKHVHNVNRYVFCLYIVTIFLNFSSFWKWTWYIHYCCLSQIYKKWPCQHKISCMSSIMSKVLESPNCKIVRISILSPSTPSYKFFTRWVLKSIWYFNIELNKKILIHVYFSSL